MKKLSIDTLNAYPTISKEELIGVKGGINPLTAFVAGATIIAGVAALYTLGKELYNDWVKEEPQEREKMNYDDFIKMLEEAAKKNGGYISCDSATVNGVYGFMFYGGKNEGCNCKK